MRETDEPIPYDEGLYRWVQADDVNGSRVLPTAIRIAQCSVNREKYWSEQPDHMPDQPAFNGLARTTLSDLPDEELVNEVSYEFFAVDAPIDGNDAHAEIRCGRKPSHDRPDGDRPGGRRPGSSKGRFQLKNAIAKAMTVTKAPTRPKNL